MGSEIINLSEHRCDRFYSVRDLAQARLACQAVVRGELEEFLLESVARQVMEHGRRGFASASDIRALTRSIQLHSAGCAN